jgi:transcriptional regulator with XRE-family HTH domain
VLGGVIRVTRQGRLSLEELAARAGISAGQLSQIENGTGNPTVEMLMKLADALDLGIPDLVEPRPTPPTYIVRASERRHHRVLSQDRDVLLMSPGIRHQLTVADNIMQPGEVFVTNRHRGEALLYVVGGALEIRQKEAEYRLAAEDCMLISPPDQAEVTSASRAEFISIYRPEAGRASGNADGEDISPSEAGVSTARRRQVARIGRRVRMLRRERLTLAQLAEQSNLSVGLLSRLENGSGNPSFAALSALGRALGVGVDSFFEEPDERPGAVVTKEDRITLGGSSGDVLLEILSPQLTSRVLSGLLTLAPGYAAGIPAAGNPGQQFETVLSGTVELHVEQEVHLLEAGDSVLFEASRPHRRVNAAPAAPARLLVCTTELRLDSFFPDRSVAWRG